MLYGRADCRPRLTVANADRFPNPRAGLTKTLEWCNSTFNFNSTWCVAILGAHTLGQARPSASGFRGPWVADARHLNNAYFQDLRNKRWLQVRTT
ncbi:APX2 [Bugula neritina]|uniref:APX2 n=1 Tax=Bugula neritina TaxID=10212 RepID=A0A7J7KMH2_BUGNE|nr:APX2 [Bugula neritina]